MALKTAAKNRKKPPDAKNRQLSRLDKQLQDEIVERLTQNFKIKHIILFGSYANGNPHQDSDIDLVVVLDEPGMAENYEQRLKQRIKVGGPLYEIRQQIPIDLLVYSREEWNIVLALNSSFIREIRKTGVSLI